MGRYKGHLYKRQRICDMLAVSSRACWWFLYDEDGEPTGDHFRTLSELKAYIDGGTI